MIQIKKFVITMGDSNPASTYPYKLWETEKRTDGLTVPTKSIIRDDTIEDFLESLRTFLYKEIQK